MYSLPISPMGFTSPARAATSLATGPNPQGSGTPWPHQWTGATAPTTEPDNAHSFIQLTSHVGKPRSRTTNKLPVGKTKAQTDVSATCCMSLATERGFQDSLGTRGMKEDNFPGKWGTGNGTGDQ
jgi:hypothetical protein